MEKKKYQVESGELTHIVEADRFQVLLSGLLEFNIDDVPVAVFARWESCVCLSSDSQSEVQ